MADGMTTGEIEDVLSSIRRLVSDGNRPMFRATPRPYAHEAEKLILTPALRVPTPETAAGASRPAPTLHLSLADSVPVEAAPARPPLGSVVTAIAAAVPPQVTGWEPETGDPADPVAPADAARAWADELAAGWTATPPATARQAPTAQDAGTTAPLWQDESGEDDGWDAQPADPTDPFPPFEAETLSAGPQGQKADTAQAAEALPVLDSAALSEMIREILREELRGPLGERITGNLRKLIRAEIARALALREQD